MKFVYWGAVNSGGDHINRLFEYNERQHLYFNNMAYSYKKYIFPEKKRYEIYYYLKPKNENKLVKILHREGRVKNPFTDHVYDYMERFNFVDHRTLNYYNNKQITNSSLERGLSGQIDTNNYEPFLINSPDTWDFAIEEMFDGEIIIRPHHLLGFSNYKRLYKPTGKIISLLRHCRNIVPYKENIIDSMISKLNMFDPPKQSRMYAQMTGRPTHFKTIVDAYKKDEEIVWGHLDEFIRQQRNIEQALIDYDIPYEHMNLDTDDYSRFGCDIILDRKFSHPNFDLSNDDVRHNYHILESMAEEYVTVRKLTDLRLSGRIYDKI